jgi:hypothetical protein
MIVCRSVVYNRAQSGSHMEVLGQHSAAARMRHDGPAATRCGNCGEPLGGAFCQTCGQKVAGPDVSLHDFFGTMIAIGLHSIRTPG